jgi:prepilin-type N-terminal cleavage/methylation domain-containing protein
MINRKRASPAFTLTEILVALAIFALAATSLLGLFSYSHRTDREGVDEGRAAVMAGSIMDSLSLSPSNGMLAIATGNTNGIPRMELLDPKTTTNRSVVYTASCEPLCPLPEERVSVPVTNPEASAVATLRLSRKPQLPCMTVAEVEISSPASAPAEGRSVRRFIRLIAVPPHG